MADYGDGAVHILSGNNKVKALGIDGLTPIFGIDADGYWTIKIGDAAAEQVKGADGNPVSAVPDNDTTVGIREDIIWLRSRKALPALRSK